MLGSRPPPPPPRRQRCQFFIAHKIRYKQMSENASNETTIEFANSVESHEAAHNEAAHNEPPHLDLHCLHSSL